MSGQKKSKKSTKTNFIKGSWCPLFGRLPVIPKTDPNDELAHTCINIIKQARSHWGIFDHDMVDDAWPHLAELPISIYRETSLEKCGGARVLFQCLDEIAWKTAPWRNEVIVSRDFRNAVVSFDLDVRRAIPIHLIEEVNKIWHRHCPDAMDPNEPSSLCLVYSLFAVHESWHVLKWLRLEMHADLFIQVLKRIDYAKGLLVEASHYEDLGDKEKLHVQIQDLELEKKNRPSRQGRIGGSQDKYSHAVVALIREMIIQKGRDVSARYIWHRILMTKHNSRDNSIKVVGEKGKKYELWIEEYEIDDVKVHKLCQDPHDSYKTPIQYESFQRYLKRVKKVK